jgi:hypothetical protein
MQIRWLDVLRDALAIVIASALVRSVALAAGASDGVVGALLLGVCVVGFCVAGCLSPSRRFAHLGLVALATWLILSLIAAASGSAGSSAAYVGLLVNPILLGMLVGGAASLAIVRRPAEPPGPAA